MNYLFRCLCFSVILLGVASLGYADTISYTTTTPISAQKTDWTGTLAFQQFDPSLGTLQSVTLQIGSTISTILTVTNCSDSSSSGTAKTEVQISVQDAGHHLADPVLDIMSPNFSYSLGAGESVTSNTLNSSLTATYSYTAILSEFTGLGTIVLDASTFTQTLLSCTGGNTTASQTTTASVTGTVTYTYMVETPEPSTLVLLGVGLLGLLVWRRRR